MVQFELMGPLRVVADDGRDATPRAGQQRRVLVALAAAAPAAVPVASLEDLLWPDGPPSGNALQALISKLRKVIAPVDIEQNGRGYALSGGYSVDVAEFEQYLDAGDPARAQRLVRGRPIDEIADDELGRAEHTRLAGRIRHARVATLTRQVEGGVPSDALSELEAVVLAEPLDETWWALLMRAQYRVGQQAEALRSFQRARVVLGDELGIEPGPELRDLERRILDQDPQLGTARGTSTAPERSESPSTRRRLPARLASFVGRDVELDTLARRAGDHRLVTVVGPGGAGKTAFALEHARGLLDRADVPMAVLVELAPVTDTDAIVRACARAIGLPDVEQATLGTAPSYERPVDRISDALSSVEGIMVVDNCEHVIDMIAPIVHQLLSQCPGLRVVATSREPLGVPGEHVYVLPPLPERDAVQLLLERVREHGGTVALDEGSIDRVATLCERLDGLPLAIELAAARLRSLSLDDVIDRLDDRFGLLSTGSRTVEPRQQTLRAVVDWSYDLLDPDEQSVFRRLSSFVGGAGLDGVVAVCAAPWSDQAELSPDRAVEIVGRLVDKSLVVAEHDPLGVRYRQLQTVRDYADERLLESGERERVLVRHAQFYADAVSPALRGLLGHSQSEWFAMIGRERQNLDAALDMALARGDAQLALELVTPLGWYFFMAAELEAGMSAMSAALACDGMTEPGQRALALGLYGWLATNGPNVEYAVGVTSEAWDMRDRVAEPWAQGLIAVTHTMSLFFAGRLGEVDAMLPELDRLTAESADPWIGAVTKLVRGEVVQFHGDAAEAERLYLESAREFDAVGDQFGYSLTITEAAEIAELLGEYDRAAELLEQGIAITERVGFSGHPLAMRARLGNIETLRGNLDLAARHHEALLGDAAARGVPWLHAMALIGLSMVARRQGRLDEAGDLVDDAWSLQRTRAVPFMRAIVRVAQGYLADQREDFALAMTYQREALDIALGLGTPRGMAYALEGVAGALALSAEVSDHELAARMLGRADAHRRASGGSMPAGERFDVNRAERRIRDRLGDEVFQCQFDGALDVDGAVFVAELDRRTFHA